MGADAWADEDGAPTSSTGRRDRRRLITAFFDVRSATTGPTTSYRWSSIRPTKPTKGDASPGEGPNATTETAGRRISAQLRRPLSGKDATHASDCRASSRVR